MAGHAHARPVTLRDWLKHAEARFRRARLHFGHGTQRPVDEAAWLLAGVLKISHEAFSASLGRVLTARERDRASRLIEKRARDRIPLAYLLREAWLGEHRFYVDRRVIVPRSYIAELLRERMHPWVADPSRVRKALDLGTGSGCLAVLIALAFPRAEVDAVDLSRAALMVAKRNVTAYRLGSRIRLARSNLFEAVAGRRYDLIVANPPYVDAKSMERLPREYRHEPRTALAGGSDGLDLVRQILQQAGDFLRPRGLLVVEIGRHRRELERAFPEVPFTWLETSAGSELVFLLHREELPGSARSRAAG